VRIRQQAERDIRGMSRGKREELALARYRDELIMDEHVYVCARVRVCVGVRARARVCLCERIVAATAR